MRFQKEQAVFCLDAKFCISTKLIVFCLFYIIPYIGAAQSEITFDPFKYKNEVTINATNLLSNLFSLSNDNLSTPYTLGYRHYFSNRFAAHLGLGTDVQNQKDVLGGSNLETHSVLYDARIGIDKMIRITNRIYFVVGLDGIIGNVKNKSFNSGFDLETSVFKIGGGPAIRFQYHLNERIVFMTEGLFYFVRTMGERQETDPNTGTAVFKSFSHKFSIAEPRALFIGFKF